jgi:ribulose-5-phosphate 4-epimerase/fuculose-1-phosphate aldolase
MGFAKQSAPAVGQFSDAEWHVRVELAALYRALHRLGMTDLIYNHITCRVPGEDHAFLINSYGMMYSEVTASSLFKVDLDGNILLDPHNGYSFNPAGFVIHSAVHRGRHDVACVLHSHTRASMAVSAMQEGLLPISQQACKFDGSLSLHEFNGPVLDLSEQARLLRDLGDNNVMLLRNHGTLVCGTTIAATFLDAYFLEMACKVQVDVMAAGASIVIPSDAVRENTRRLYRQQSLDGQLEWQAMCRVMEASGEDYAV